MDDRSRCKHVCDTYESVYVQRSRLSESMRAVDGLRVHEGVPMQLQQHRGVHAAQRRAQSAAARRQQQQAREIFGAQLRRRRGHRSTRMRSASEIRAESGQVDAAGLAQQLLRLGLEFALVDDLAAQDVIYEAS